MANEISVRTAYTFLSSDGTAYNGDHTFFADATATAMLPKRYGFFATQAGTPILNFGTDTEQIQQLRGAALVWIINRDPNCDMVIQLTNLATDSETRTLKPLQWLYLNVAELTVNATFVVAASVLTGISAQCEALAARGELITIYKATS